MFTYTVDEDITLELQAPYHTELLYPVIDANRQFIGEHLSWALVTNSRERLAEYLQRDLRGMVTGRRWAWLIRYRGEIVGRTGIWVTNSQLREFEMHYWLAEDATGKGIMTRATRCIVDFAFTELKLEHLLIGFTPRNNASRGVAERLGLQHEFTMRQAQYQNGEWHDLVFYGLLNDEWTPSSEPQFAKHFAGENELRIQELRHAPANYDLIRRNADELRHWFDRVEDHTLASERAYIRSSLEDYADGTGVNCAIFHRGERAGAIKLAINLTDRSARVSYLLDSAFQGQGIVVQALRTMMAYVFDTLDLERFFIGAGRENTARRTAAENAGMLQEATLRHANWVNGHPVDYALYSILRDEWQSQKEELEQA